MMIGPINSIGVNDVLEEAMRDVLKKYKKKGKSYNGSLTAGWPVTPKRRFPTGSGYGRD